MGAAYNASDNLNNLNDGCYILAICQIIQTMGVAYYAERRVLPTSSIARKFSGLGLIEFSCGSNQTADGSEAS